MFCDRCGSKTGKESVFCDECGQFFAEPSWRGRVARPIERFFRELCRSLLRLKVEIGTRRLIVGLVLLIGGYLIYDVYANTQDQLRKSTLALQDLKESTADAILAQKKLIEQQGESISKQSEALKKSQTNEELLRIALDRAASARVSAATNPSITNALLKAIAPSVVKIYCSVGIRASVVQQGSGILYHSSDGSYYVQTNLHVADTEDGSLSKCVIFVYPDYSSSSNFLLFSSHGYKFYKKNFDIALLTPELVSGNSHSGTLGDLSRYARREDESPRCESVNIGDHLSVLGYPSIGGDTLTVTDGIVSGFEFSDGARYLKTSAKIDHGNSGGIAIKDSGCVAGIPTFVAEGEAESIGRILDLHYLFNVLLK